MKITTVYSGPGYPIDPMRQIHRDLEADPHVINDAYRCEIVNPESTLHIQTSQVLLDVEKLIAIVERCLADRRIPVEALNLQRADQVHVRAKVFAEKFFEDRENDTLIKRKHMRKCDEANANLV